MFEALRCNGAVKTVGFGHGVRVCVCVCVCVCDMGLEGHTSVDIFQDRRTRRQGGIKETCWILRAVVTRYVMFFSMPNPILEPL